MPALPALLPLLLAGALPGVQSLVNARDSLGSVSAVGVVAVVDEPARKAGVTPAAVTAQAEAALRKRGITVAEYGKGEAQGGAPGAGAQLKVELVAVTGSTGSQAFLVARYDVSVSQWAALESDPTAAAFARTWTDGGVLIAPREQAQALVRDAVAGAVDAFCKDYLAARAEWLAARRARER